MKAQFGPEAIVYDDGTLARSAAVNVFLTGTSTPATIYANAAGTVAGTNPVLTDGFGNLKFYSEPGTYDLELNGKTVTVTIDVPGGSSGGDNTLVYTQSTPLAQWNIPHLLGRQPHVQVYVGTEVCLTDISADDDSVTITFPAPTAGVAVIG